MGNGYRLFFMAALCAAVCSLAARGADDPKNDDHSKPVQFDTIDGVQLEGRFYAAAPIGKAKAKEATVLLLHNINSKTGGSSNQPGWDELARMLQDDGYSVLKFDFRGFGNSTNVSPQFWKELYNSNNVRGGTKAKPPSTISHKDFDNKAAEYYPYLVNDIAAAKAYLDRRNDAGQANTSSLIVIGAGEGATLGAMWMASEWHRHKVNGGGGIGVVGIPVKISLEEPEGRDEAAAVWLNLSPKLGNREIPSAVHNWLAEMSGSNKVAMGFVYGSQDEAAAASAKRDLGAIAGQIRRDNPNLSDEALQKLMKKKGIGSYPLKDTKVTGSELLTANDSAAQKWIVNNFLKSVMEERGAKESRTRAAKEDTFVWTFPGLARPIEAKMKNDDNLRPVPVSQVLRLGGN
jgi:pimeloyl-ACP methyl ester carboxylesterase